ncbi:dihydrodipicolinate synthase family protein [Campylobacter geochelonis]|uniref:Dihydrodipicolinate synthase n=1 Tax=Campylobacter geochelonis TaxID=1780362 RepID=A0A128EJS7_9BACT|nr:dihydrodipicolinate synthase family protein [Campylobacter geochelonis]QKF71092.1 dihydrodipicolinate synthase family protein [Campylobacter geochelonis]CZE48351.1 dihydrodipicolinate synthase [Campylobacter geochelonis]CZE48877.1 dihydrodipicolinate synthase [Campylobacter geochelonis]CZE50092.1 dihydrodipicolinate synthase [Campylobacter geochelonis]
MKARIFTPTVTIFDDNQKLDLQANARVLDYLINSGIDGVLLLGSTGEFSAFSLEERKKLVEFCVKKVDGRVPVMAGVTSMDFNETLEMTKFVHSLGVKAMVLMPYYFGANQKNIFDYYDAVAKKTDGDIYIYNYPGRTTCEIEAATLLNLALQNPNLKGIKDTVGNVSHTKELIKALKPKVEGFEIYSGFDDHFIDNVTAGGAGCISGLSNIAPVIWSGFVKAYNENDLTNLAKYAKAINKLMEIYALDINFSLIFKKLMNLEGLEINERAIFPYNFLADGLFEKAREILASAKEIIK